MEKYKIILLCCCLLAGCTSKRRFFPRDMDEQHIEIVRFDKALMNVREETAKQDIRLLYDEYEGFMDIFVEDILGIAVADTDTLCRQLPLFLNDTLYGFRQTNQKVAEVFADIKDIERDLDGAFTRIRYLYPDLALPTVYFFISGFNASLMFVNDDIAVGTDMYLGSDYDWYNRVVYDYQKQTMRKECIAVDVASAYLFRHLPYTSTKNRLLENMIYRGKIMYLLSLLFPDQPKYEIMGYTQTQWAWCEHYERAVWNRMMDNRDLFKTESMLLTSYLNDGPFTSEISQEAPARLGTWMGWRITESYMNHHPDITLQALMENGDAQKILEESYYRP